MSGPRQRIAQNPFYVLGVGVHATRVEVEREGQKLLGMLAVGLSAARHYVTPLGRFERTESNVRAAMAELRDPVRRAKHSLWAGIPAADDGVGSECGADDVGGHGAAAAFGSDNEAETGTRAVDGVGGDAVRWPHALERLGWRAPTPNGASTLQADAGAEMEMEGARGGGAGDAGNAGDAR